MHAAKIPRTVAFVGLAMLAALVLLVWFTVVVQQAETRGQHRRAYQQMTGQIMKNVEPEQVAVAGRRVPMRADPMVLPQR